MFRKLLLSFFFLFFNFLHADIQKPELIFRPQSAQEAFSYVLDLSEQLPWFEKNGYIVALPTHSKFSPLYLNAKIISENDKNELNRIFLMEIYDESLFDLSLSHLHESESIIRKGLEKLSILKENWNFKLLDKYDVILTLYGPGGDSDSEKGSILLFTTPSGHFKRNTGYEVLFHEIVHIGIEDIIVKNYGLQHWEKERLVDLICIYYLKDLIPEYMMQKKGNKLLDAFIDEYNIIHDLPTAIARFVQHYPR